MQIWLLDYNSFIKVNGIQEVTNPVMFDKGHTPTEDGLFSTEIFGVTTKERRETWGYIDLHGKYIAPKVYISLKRLNRNFESVVYSTKNFTINKEGILVEDENGGTGIKWLYDNWEKIKFNKNDSVYRNERVDLLTKTPKDTIFISKEIVLPAFYRDVNLQSDDGNPKVPLLSELYTKILRNALMIKESNNMDFIIASLVGKTQDLLVDVYNELKMKLEKKHGYIRSFLMGKSIDYSSRVVITSAPYTEERPSDHEIDFYHVGVPLSQLCAEFTPFIIWWLNRWFKTRIESWSNGYPMVNSKGEKTIIKLADPASYYNDDYIEHHLESFVDNPYSRFDPIELPVSVDERKRAGIKGTPLMMLHGYTQTAGTTMNKIEIDKENGTEVTRPITWTDLLYMAAIDVTSDKHVIVTRYPMLDYNGQFIARPSVISTRETMPMMVDGVVYPHYPVIDINVPKTDLDSIFRDTVNICALYLKVMDADFDGDQVTTKGVYSQEANDECERVMVSKMNLLTVEGKGSRVLDNEATQTLYSFTKFH